MLTLLQRPRPVLAAAVAGAALAGGIAYATIPDANKVYTACMLKATGTIRLIDPSLPASSPMGHCDTKLETQISWNQQGQPGPAGTAGPQGPQGLPGKDGSNGVSVASAAEAPGANCATGGSKFTSASGDTYACNGKDGSSGPAATVTTTRLDYAVDLTPPATPILTLARYGTIAAICLHDASGDPANPGVELHLYALNTTNGQDASDLSLIPAWADDPTAPATAPPDAIPLTQGESEFGSMPIGATSWGAIGIDLVRTGHLATFSPPADADAGGGYARITIVARQTNTQRITPSDDTGCTITTTVQTAG